MTDLRNCVEVITEMMSLVPPDRLEFLAILDWCKEAAKFQPADNTEQWDRTLVALQKYCRTPHEDWEFSIWSIFTTLTVDQIKAQIANTTMRNN